MVKKLNKVRNQRLSMVKSKSKQLERGLGIKPEDWKRAVAVDYVIDTNKRTSKNQEPRMSD